MKVVLAFLAVFGLMTAINDHLQARDSVAVAASEDVSVTIVRPGPVCAQGKLANGETVSLMGVAKSTRLGTKLKLEGLWVKRSTCMRGRTFHATRMHEAKI